MTPLVTILLPTLNERAFVTDCLDSLCDEDYPEVDEILVVDGGSTDGTRESYSAMAAQSDWSTIRR